MKAFFEWIRNILEWAHLGIHFWNDRSVRIFGGRPFNETDLVFLRQNAEVSSLSTGMILGQIEQYIDGLSDDLDSLSFREGKPADGDLLARFRVAQMRCRSEQMLDEIDVFRNSVLGFAHAEKEVIRTLERREKYSSDLEDRQLTEREAVCQRKPAMISGIECGCEYHG